MAPSPGVLFISSHATLGGSELYLQRILEGLGPGWVRGVVSLAEGPWVEQMRALGVPVEVLPTGARAGIVVGALRLRRVLARDRPAVIHANGVKAALVGVLAAPGRGIPIVWVKHDFSWDGPLARLIAARCNCVVAVSEAVAAALTGRLRHRVRIVPNGIPDIAVDRAAGRAAVERLTGAAPDDPVLTMVGRIDPVKAQRELVECLPGLLERYQGLRVLLVGEPDRYRPEYAERLHARICELGVQRSVTLAGRREDAVSLISGSDVVVIPTMRDERGMGTEGFGLVGVEAMAVGTPVAGYADGALPEVLGPCAALVTPGDRAALTSAIAALLADPAERERLAACGRARVTARYRVSDMIEAMRTQYTKAVDHPTRRAAGPWAVVLRQLRRRRCIVLAFHGVAPRDPVGDPHNHLLPPDRFRTEVRRLLDAGFEFVTVAELVRRMGDGAPPPGLAVLSFDHGMDNNHAVLLPLLRELGVPATVYVITGLIGRPNPWMGEGTGARMMTAGELRELYAAGVEIGSHTVTHPDLTELDEAACLEEMAASKAALEGLLGRPVETFAYPYCRYGSAAVAAGRRAGYTAAVTCLGRDGWDPHELKRTIVTGRDGPVAFALKLLEAYEPLFDSAVGRAFRASTRGLRRRLRRE